MSADKKRIGNVLGRMYAGSVPQQVEFAPLATSEPRQNFSEVFGFKPKPAAPAADSAPDLDSRLSEIPLAILNEADRAAIKSDPELAKAFFVRFDRARALDHEKAAEAAKSRAAAEAEASEAERTRIGNLARAAARVSK